MEGLRFHPHPEGWGLPASSFPILQVKKALPASADLMAWCPPIEDQGELGSCTANAGVGLFEYFERKASGTHIDASHLFLYKGY